MIYIYISQLFHYWHCSQWAKNLHFCCPKEHLIIAHCGLFLSCHLGGRMEPELLLDMKILFCVAVAWYVMYISTWYMIYHLCVIDISCIYEHDMICHFTNINLKFIIMSEKYYNYYMIWNYFFGTWNISSNVWASWNPGTSPHSFKVAPQLVPIITRASRTTEVTNSSLEFLQCINWKIEKKKCNNFFDQYKKFSTFFYQ